MKRTTNRTKIALGFALAVALVPGPAYAAQGPLEAATVATPVVERLQATLMSQPDLAGGQVEGAATGEDAAPTEAGNPADQSGASVLGTAAGAISDAKAAAEAAATSKLLAYDPALIAQIGTQEQTGHTICCPSFSCAYADAVLDGTVHDHSYYTCSCCTWTDWGGGNSSYRCVGTDQQLLREAYDQISAGRPTVIHVSASYGEHWIALIGYEHADDPDNLSLANFIALDPWDGAQINAASRFNLYGDGCEHISDR